MTACSASRTRALNSSDARSGWYGFGACGGGATSATARGAGATGTHGIDSAVVLAENQTWTNAATVDFMVSGAISGSHALAKRGGGRIVLANDDSTFTGVLTIEEGALQVRGTNALGTTVGGTVVEDGATLELHGGGVAVRYATEPLTLRGAGVTNGGALRFV